MSAVAGPSWRTHIMLNRMCRALPCSQPALSTVHHMPSLKTGIAPLAPNARATRGMRRQHAEQTAAQDAAAKYHRHEEHGAYSAAQP